MSRASIHRGPPGGGCEWSVVVWTGFEKQLEYIHRSKLCPHLEALLDWEPGSLYGYGMHVGL